MSSTGPRIKLHEQLCCLFPTGNWCNQCLPRDHGPLLSLLRCDIDWPFSTRHVRPEDHPDGNWNSLRGLPHHRCDHNHRHYDAFERHPKSFDRTHFLVGDLVRCPITSDLDRNGRGCAN